ncbi:TRAP-type transport system, small permease component [Indibacter alkaliphilus LW1]|uniref:TRAP-type transport system, small permease component n=1 Tax=Indibacter alkaliphilus (strain CCUG 57479 / KCTC 22604 / LW1) TaxID=1189612 RepID=S2DHR5_INDAL|nr:TRAP transporter small permease [Indibacter alkaliphilus]EOZ98519.1 TRAP-type transport system, small permease component [Indibacter alkaliphilus LW1]
MTHPKTKILVDKIVSVFLMFLMGTMVLNVTWQVLSRYVVQNPASFTDELSRYMLIWLGMLGAAYVAGKDQHLAIDILPQKLEGKAKIRLVVLINLIVMLFAFLAMVLGGSNLVYITFILEQKSATLQLPLAYIYSVIPMSGLLVMYYNFYQISTQLKTQKQ